MSIREYGRRAPQWWELGCAPLDRLSSRTRQALCRAGDMYTVSPGQTVLLEGRSVKWVFIVLEGELVLRRCGQDVTRLRAGCLYGALESLTSGRAPADLVATELTRVLAVETRAYTALVETRADFASWVLRALARQEAA